MQACSYSMRRLWIPAFLFCVPDAHSVSGYPVFSTDAVSVFSFRISFPAFPDTRIRSHLHGSLLHFLRSHLQFFFPALCSGVSYMPIFPVTAQSRVPSGIFGSGPVCGTSGLFHWMIDKFSPQDSSVCPHNGTDRIGIDSQVHTTDDLFFYRCLRKCHFFRIRKTQEIFMVPFLQCRADAFFPDQFLRRYSISV
mgnify:CR=1 FL=1